MNPCATMIARSPGPGWWMASIGTPSSVTRVVAVTTGLVIHSLRAPCPPVAWRALSAITTSGTVSILVGGIASRGQGGAQAVADAFVGHARLADGAADGESYR